ncbi:MAG: glycosyltransferase family 4 protein [Pyrinomonadaceae bacterium]
MQDRPLKFCMVSTFYPPYSFGGDAMHIYRLSNELAKRGHLVDVFHCEDAFMLLNKKAPSAAFPNHENVTVHSLKSGKGFLSPLATQQTGVPFFKHELRAALEQNDYDVIHYHNMSLIGIAALSYGEAVKLYTTHEHWLICPMHVLWKFNREVCTTKSCFTCQLKGRRPPQLWRQTGLMERMVEYVDCFLSPSRFTLKKHLDAGLDIPIRHLPYFLPTPEKHEVPEPVYTERPFFLFVGRLEYIKGVQNLIPVFKNQSKCDLLIAGDGEYKRELEQHADGCERIKFLGRLDQQELRRLYGSAMAVIVPSICFETFGIIIIEAFSCKTPVIVNDLGALSEVVEDSGGGFVYRSQEELIAAMNKLAGDRDLRDQLGENGNEAFLKYWTEEAHIEQYLSLVEELRSKRVLKRAAAPAHAQTAITV